VDAVVAVVPVLQILFDLAVPEPAADGLGMHSQATGELLHRQILFHRLLGGKIVHNKTTLDAAARKAYHGE
jgi:hypothetical protein